MADALNDLWRGLEIAIKRLGKLDKPQLFLEHILNRIKPIQGKQHLEECVGRGKPRPLQPRNRRHRNTRAPRKVGLRPFLALTRKPNQLSQTRQHIFNRR